MAKKSSSDGRTVELKDKETGFYDPQTGLKLVHDQKVELGETVGKKTNRAIVSGALLVVGELPKAKGLEGGRAKAEEEEVGTDA